MNAEQYLRKQGWQGSGHSLDSTGRGIKKPLLISHKTDQLGLGKKKAAHTTDDQWWMRAFDASLQSIGTGKESTLSQIREKGINRGGLYGFFVKGEPIEGTIEDPSATTTDASNPPSSRSTPPTSASDTEASARIEEISNDKILEKRNKRKREADEGAVSKKSKKAKAEAVEAKAEEPQVPRKAAKGGDDEQAAVAKKLAKLKPAEKAYYEERATAKNQTLEEYVLHRVQKKAKKHATEPAEDATEATEAAAPPMFFTDLEGDSSLGSAAPAKALNREQRRALKKQAKEQEKKNKPAEAAEEQPENTESEKPKNGLKDQSDFISIQQPQEPISLQVRPDAPVFTYTPLPDGTAPLNPKLWKEHKTKDLPKSIKEARRAFQVEQRLNKRLRKAQGDSQKNTKSLTQAETQLLRKRILEDEMGIDPKEATKEQIEKANLEMEKRVHRQGGFSQKGTREWKEMKKIKKAEKQAAKRERKGWAPKKEKK